MSDLEEVLALQIRADGLPEPEREYRFAKDLEPPRLWRFDFAWPEVRLAVEVEGGVWANGRHTRPKGYAEDLKKYNTAVQLGWRVLRFESDWITFGGALKAIRRELGMEEGKGWEIPTLEQG